MLSRLAFRLLLPLWLPFSACSPGPDAGLPEPYRSLEVPEARLADPASRARGAALFATHCALCHGPRGDGHGARTLLSTRPADFTSPAWRTRATPRRAYYAVREGVPGTAMPGWPTLTEEEAWDVVGFVMGVGDGIIHR